MELNKKDKTVFRLKIARDSDGRVICPMQKEVYVVQRWQAQLKQTENSEKIAIFLHLYKKIRIFAAWNPHGNPQKLLYSGKNGQKVAETHSEKEASSTFVVAMGLQNETSLTRFFNLRQFVSIMSSINDNSRII